MYKYLQYLSQTLLNWIYPNHCLLCQQLSQSPASICHNCQPHLPWQTQYCYQCAIPLIATNIGQLCGQCLTSPPYFDRSFCAWHYQPPISKYITQLKFNHQLHLASLLGLMLADYLKQQRTMAELPECLIPIPLHRQRLRKRGFNQALEIARPLARQLKVPIAFYLCTRNKNTLPQTKLNAHERKRNLRDAFKVTSQLLPAHVAIIDDVMTTETTVNALSRTLKQHGVKKIEVWCCARAAKSSK